MQAPWEIITTMGIDGLEEAENDPDIHRYDVKIACDGGPSDRCYDCTDAENEDFDRRCIFCGKTEGSRVVVMDFVDVLVERTPVKCAVSPVVPGIFNKEEDYDLICYLRERGEGYANFHAEICCHGVEEPDLRQFNREVNQEDGSCALPLFL